MYVARVRTDETRRPRARGDALDGPVCVMICCSYFCPVCMLYAVPMNSQPLQVVVVVVVPVRYSLYYCIPIAQLIHRLPLFRPNLSLKSRKGNCCRLHFNQSSVLDQDYISSAQLALPVVLSISSLISVVSASPTLRPSPQAVLST